jgi:phenol 2-monooxygenase (NADPH)
MDEEGISMEEFKSAFEKGNMFASGIAVDYGASIIVAKEGDLAEQGDGTNMSVAGQDEKKRVVGKQHLSSDIKIGMRMPSFQVLNQADARPLQFQELLKSNGRWRIVLFAGDLQNPHQWSRMTNLAQTLSHPLSFLSRYNGRSGPNSTIEILTLHSSPRTSIEFLDLPDIFHPFFEAEGWDYWKVFVDDVSYHEGHGHAYQGYGVDSNSGCLVILRPDQYVSWIGELEDTDEMERFLR